MTRLFLFHGGTPGLREGESILPPSLTGVRSATLESTLKNGLAQIAQRLDMVYMTSDVNLARVYAGMWTAPGSITSRAGGGWIYQVEARDGALEPDQDLLSLSGVSFQADAAVITGIHDKNVPYDQERFRKKLASILRDHERAKRTL